MTTVCPPLCTDKFCAIASFQLGTYSLQDSIYTNGTISVTVNCLPGYFFPAGNCPVTITFLPGTFIIPLIPTTPGPIVIALMGCLSLVQIILPAGSSPAAIAAAAQSVITQVAQQQAICNVVTPPGDPPVVPPPNPIPTFFNQPVYYSCASGSVISYTGVVPGWLTVDTVNNRLVMAAGLIGGATQALANLSAQNTLNSFGDAAVISGDMVCTCFTTGATLPPGTVGVVYSEILVEASPGVGTFALSSGTLPAGLSLNPNTGEISGTPTTAGTSIFIISFSLV